MTKNDFSRLVGSLLSTQLLLVSQHNMPKVALLGDPARSADYKVSTSNVMGCLKSALMNPINYKAGILPLYSATVPSVETHSIV